MDFKSRVWGQERQHLPFWEAVEEMPTIPPNIVGSCVLACLFTHLGLSYRKTSPGTDWTGRQGMFLWPEASASLLTLECVFPP